MNKINVLFAWILCTLSTLVDAQDLSTEQQLKIDSLKNVIKSADHDTSVVKALIKWDNIIYYNNPELDLELNQRIDSISSLNLKKSLKPAEKQLFLKFKSIASGNLGLIYNASGENKKALEYLFDAVELRKELGDHKRVAYALNNIGAIYNEQGMHDKAIEYYTKSLVIHEEVENKHGIGGALNNIAIIHKSQGNFESAIDFYNKSLQVKIDNKDTNAIAVAYLNIGALYLEQTQFDKARSYFRKSLKLSQEKEEQGNISRAYVNLGTVFQQEEKLDSALHYCLKGYAIQEEMNDQKVLAETSVFLGSIYYDLDKIDKAKIYAEQALELAFESDVIKVSERAADLLYKIYKRTGESNKSLEMLELSFKLQDSINSEKNQKEVIRQQFKYEYEKQAATDSIKAAEEAKVKDAMLETEQARSEQQEQQKYFFIGFLVIAMIFGGFAFNRYRVTRKQKTIIEDQKESVDSAYEILEEKNREILDSINYAQRIQRSFLASDQLLSIHLKDYFIYFNPKEAVSGDFYWADQLSNGNFAISCADSTGHGVPGAIMSILNVSSIERAVEKGLTHPADIFNETRKLIIDRLNKDGSEHGGKDGMDASLISLNLKELKMEYVAAHNPIWIIRNGELIDLKGEKMPVGKHDHDDIPFKGGAFDLKRGDIIYAITDGFQDQFGGPKGKKYKVRPMKQMLLEIADRPMKDQHDIISQTFNDWKGDLEQVDDVCIIGIKV